MKQDETVVIEERVGYMGREYIYEYSNCDDFSVLPYDRCKQVRSVCFYNDKIIVGLNGEKGTWGLIGGTIEKGESFLEALEREVNEEANATLLKSIPVGYQKVTEKEGGKVIYQLRYVSHVTLRGPFVSDPAGSITKIEFIDINDYKKYFNWGRIGDRIIERVKELKEELFKGD